MASNRRISRIAVIQTLFAWEFREIDEKAMLVYLIDEFYPKLTQKEFAENNLAGILKKRDEIKAIIEETAPEWSFDKIAPVDRVILEQGVYEIIGSDDVPPVVAINEAIEIAKEFGNPNSPKFVNGVLSTVMKKYKPQKNDKE
jgi:transcription antitermination protein NusB